MLQDCKHCGFPWPKLDEQGRCAACVMKAKREADPANLRSGLANAARRAREMAAEHDRAWDGCAYLTKALEHRAARDALLALAERLGGEAT